MEIVNLLHLTWKRVAVLLLAAFIGAAIGMVASSNQKGEFTGSSEIIVSSLMGLDQPDYVAGSFTKSVRDLVVESRNVSAAEKASNATVGPIGANATVSDGGTTVLIDVPASSAADAKALALALGTTATNDAAARQLRVASAGQASATATLSTAQAAVDAFDTANGTDISDSADLPQAERDRRTGLRTERERLEGSVTTAQRAVDDATGRLAEANVISELAKGPDVVTGGDVEQASVMTQRLTFAGGGAALALALVLVVMLLADRRKGKPADPETMWPGLGFSNEPATTGAVGGPYATAGTPER